MVHGVFRKMEEELQVLVSWGPPAFKDCFVRLFEKVFLFSLQFHTSASIRNSFKKQTNKSTTDLHNHSHPEAAIFKTSLCSFWKVLVQRQKSENRQMFSSSFFFFFCQDPRVTGLRALKPNLLIHTIDVLQSKPKNYSRPFFDGTMATALLRHSG